MDFLYTNADQFVNKRDELCMSIAGNEPDIMCITEVIPKAQTLPIAPALLAIPGYSLYSNFDLSSPSLGSSGVRGICMYVKLGIQAVEVSPSQSPFSEQLWLRIKLRGGDSLLVGAIYRSPTADPGLTSHLCNLLVDVANSKPSHLLIMGDFNISCIDWTCNMSTGPPTHPSHLLLEAVYEAYLVQHVMHPTRFRQGDTPHILDLIFTNEEGLISNLFHLPPLGSSDHEVLRFSLTCYTSKRMVQDSKLNLNRGDYSSMATDMQNVPWESMEPAPLEEYYEFFSDTLRNSMTRHIPKQKHQRNKKNIYMTSEALALKNRKNKRWRKYLRSRDQADFARFVRARNDLRKLTRGLRRDFERHIAGKIKDGVKPFWRYVNSRIRSKTGIEDLKRADGSLTQTDQEKADLLSDFFSSVFQTEDCSSLPSLPRQWEGPFLERVEISPALVEERLRSLKISTSPGPDQIPSRVLRELASPLSVPICTLFEKSLVGGSLPSEWKQASVVPIHKSGSRQEPSNYRPVSLTSVLSKVLEGVVRDRLMNFLMETRQLHDAQHGFLPRRSCATQLLASLEDWTQLMERKEPVDVAYLDFRKAFDSVPHRRLIQKLNDLGVRGPLLRWIEAFLTGRTQQVAVNGKQSNPTPVRSGIPQGSVLGPVLFLVYVNDLPESVKCDIKLFADDAKLYASSKQGNSQHSQMQADLQSLANWSATWLLPFNVKKCKILYLGTGNIQDEYSLFGASVQRVAEERDLGVIIDEQLKFRKQAAVAVSKASQILGVIRRSFELLDSQTLPLLFKTLVRPHLEYGNIVWGPFNKEDQRLVERVQRRATRLVPDVRHLPYQERLRKLQLPSLQYRRRRGDVIMVYMLLNGHLNMTREDFFQPAPTTRTRGHPLKLAKPRAQSRVRRNHWSVRAINDWNSLPSHVVLAPSTNVFKNLLDKHWFQHSYDIPA